MAKPKGVLGFDPGSQSTGWCAILAGHIEESGTICLNAKWGFEERRAELRRQAREIIERYRRRIDVVAVEEPFSANIGVSKKLTTLKATIEECACAAGVWYVSITPAEWHELVRKRAVAGSGTIKEMCFTVAGAVMKRQPTSQDEADACFIALFAYENVVVG